MSWESARKADQAALDKIDGFLNPGEKQPQGNKKPYYATGARCFIKMAGKPMGLCQDFKWSVSYNSTPIMTVDTVFPWDIDVGQAQISATLSKIIDPLRGPEADNLFPVMAAAVHQPMVELQVIYKAVVVDNSKGQTITEELINRQLKLAPSAQNTPNTTPIEFSMFFARGMFTAVSGNATLGQMSMLSATFVGVAYQHYVSQAFVPYGASYVAQQALAEAQSLASTLSGGFL